MERLGALSGGVDRVKWRGTRVGLSDRSMYCVTSWAEPNLQFSNFVEIGLRPPM